MCTFVESVDQASGHVVLTELSSLCVVEFVRMVGEASKYRAVDINSECFSSMFDDLVRTVVWLF